MRVKSEWCLPQQPKDKVSMNQNVIVAIYVIVDDTLKAHGHRSDV